MRLSVEQEHSVLEYQRSLMSDRYRYRTGMQQVSMNDWRNRVTQHA